MIIWPAALWLMKLAIGFGNRQIVDTGKAILHPTGAFGKLPILIAISAEPIAAIVPLIWLLSSLTVRKR
jgi:hypothetical protein